MFNVFRYFRAAGSADDVVQLLSSNYTAVAQMVNLMAELMIQSGKSVCLLFLYSCLNVKINIFLQLFYPHSPNPKADLSSQLDQLELL